MSKKFSIVLVGAFALGLAILPLQPGRTAVPTAPQDPEVIARKAFILSTLTKCYIGTNDVANATATYKQVSALLPKDARLRFDYGTFMLRSGNPTAGASALYQAAKLERTVPEYQAAAGMAAMLKKSYTPAVTFYTNACRLGGKFQNELQVAQQYQAREQQMAEYNKQLKQQQTLQPKKKDDDDDD
jgi:predicted Zn-dependent protease